MARIIRKIFQTLGLLNRGHFEEKCDAELARLLEAVEQHPEEKVSGTLTITLTVTKLGDRLDLSPKVDVKLPKEKPFSGTTFWPLEGGLSVEHPSQADMFAPREARAREADFV